LENFSKLGKALWADTQYSKKYTLDTVSAVALLSLTPERALEKAATALLERAKVGGNALNSSINVQRLNESFFRLSLEERFILVTLHCGHWSYSRISRILGCTEEFVQEAAWRARLQISIPNTVSAPVTLKGQCPEYHQRRPWTQRFLDEEISNAGERFFLQNHLLVCSSCFQVLNRCRDVYFRVDDRMSEWVGGDSIVSALEAVLKVNPVAPTRSERTLMQSLSVFVKKWDVRFMLAALGLLVIQMILRFVFHRT
jgi:hypothetical protein